MPLRDESDYQVDEENEDKIVRLAEVFISVNPAEPVIEKLEELTNGLLAFGYPYRVKSTDFIHLPTLEGRLQAFDLRLLYLCSQVIIHRTEV